MTAKEIDVLIIGGGSAGLCAGAWLARNGISYRILERRPGMLTQGQADGVQVRTIEIFESFGISEELLKEAYHVIEDTFWSSEDDGSDQQQQEGLDGVGGSSRGIRRTHSTPDTEPGLSHLPHVILNQARINAILTDLMVDASGAASIEYDVDVRDVSIDPSLVEDPDAYCVTVNAMKGEFPKVYKAKYVLGSDGAHSQVRKSLGFTMIGDSSDEVWGVMDIYPKTNFPDIRKKVIVKSESGTMIIIPREGDSLVRLYMNLSGDVAAAKHVTLAQLHDKARRIFQPYTMDFPETAWWSAYVIGQRLASEFHAHYRVFLSGDACHTHSPKAGQGMNVSLQDGYNIGWKLAAVLRKQASPELLKTYVLERQKTAADLIDFDRYWSKLFSAGGGQGSGITPELFVKAGRYTAGLATQYEASMITATATSQSSLAKNLTIGMRFPSARVVRVGDAKPMWLTGALPADSRWHLVVFGGDILDEDTATRLHKLGSDLEDLVRTLTPPESDPDPKVPKPKGIVDVEKQCGVLLPNGRSCARSLTCKAHAIAAKRAVAGRSLPYDMLLAAYQKSLEAKKQRTALDVTAPPLDSFFNVILVLSSKRANVELQTIPKVFTPETGKWKLKNILKIFVEDETYSNTHARAYEAYGIDPKQGAMVVIRPDQYIARVGPLEDVNGINAFFSGFMRKHGI